MSLFSFLIITLLGLLICYIVFDNTNFKEGEIIIAPVWGLLLGVHYNKDYEENNDVIHTWQFSLFLCIITFKWVTSS